MTQITWRGKSVKTPQGAELQIPYKPLADKVQAEWDKTEKPDPKTMLWTVCAVSVIDIIIPKRKLITEDISQFIHADVIYYFDDRDEALIKHQHNVWDKWKVAAEKKLKTEAKTVNGIVPIQQSDTYYKEAMKILTSQDDWHFYALQMMISACHSWVLGVGLFDGDLTAEQAVKLSHADVLYQEQHWGIDEQATQERQDMIKELEEIQNYLHLLYN